MERNQLRLSTCAIAQVGSQLAPELSMSTRIAGTTGKPKGVEVRSFSLFLRPTN